MVKVTTNASDYKSTLRLYGRVRKMAHVDVVNRFAMRVNFRLVNKDTDGGVRRAKLGMFPLNAAADPEKQKKNFKGRFFYANAAALGVKKGSGGTVRMRPAAKRLWSKRRSAKGAMAAGFLVSARKLGLKKKGAKSVQAVPNGSASKSVGKIAKGRKRIAAESVNAVEGSYEVGKRTMDKAIDYVIDDQRTWALKEIQKANDKASRGR